MTYTNFHLPFKCFFSVFIKSIQFIFLVCAKIDVSIFSFS
jgi:hypothetical protein